MISRRDLLASSALAAALTGRVRAQTAVPRLGYIWLGKAGTDGATLKGLHQGLKELGYIEGRTILIERRYGEGDPKRLPAVIGELLAMRVDVIVGAGTIVSQAVQRATTTVPVVATSGDPVGSGLVATLAHPGGNITGLTLGTSAQFATKWVGLIKQMVPSLNRAAVLYNPTSPVARGEATPIMNAMRELSISGRMIGASSADQIDGALAAVASASPQGLIVTDDPLFVAEARRVVAFSATQKLPAVYGLGELVDAGGLMSYSASVFEMYRQVARYVDRILKGARPADMPVEEPTKFELRVNLKTARALGITVPTSLLSTADEVIE